MITDEIINEFFDKYINGWMFSDIQVCLNGGANFACILLICCDIDCIGSFIKGGQYGFENFLCKGYFSENYTNKTKELKDIFRNGLAHEFFPKCKSAFAKDHGDWHLKIIKLSHDSYFYIDAEIFFEDFKDAITQYRKRLKTNAKLRENFKKRYNQICSNKINELKKLEKISEVLDLSNNITAGLFATTASVSIDPEDPRNISLKTQRKGMHQLL